jgi:hypothetical protein
VQATARDLLAAAMLGIEAAGYPVVHHAHDEVVTEVLEGFGGEDEFVRLMVEPPEWAARLPIAAKAWRRKRYAKTAAPSASETTPVDADSKERSNALGNARRPENSDRRHGDGTHSQLYCEDMSLLPVARQISGASSPGTCLADLIGQPLADGKLACPFHDDSTPSLHIYDDHFHCFGCGAHGDRVDWLMMVDGLSRDAAEDMLEIWQGPVQPRRERPEDDGRTLASALQLWDDAGPIAGTLAELYLAEWRCIDVGALPGDLDAVLRFHPRCPFGPGTHHPCLVALFRDVRTDAPAGIHRIALTPEGDKIERKSLGRWPGVRAIKLWPVGLHLVVGEGLETVLAAATRIPYGGAPLRPAWAMGPGGGMAKLPVLQGVERLVLLVDNDPTGLAVADRCEERWRCARHAVVRLTPKRPGDDFNDILMRSNAS